MASSRTGPIYQITVITLGVVLLIPLILFASSDRDSFILFVSGQLHRSYLTNLLEERIISPGKFTRLHRISYVLIGGDPLMIWLAIRWQKKILPLLRFIWLSVLSVMRSLVRVFSNSSSRENIIVGILLLFFVLRSLYYMSTINLQYDEIWCFNYFTDRPFYLIFFSYNNYPLFELFTHVTKWLPLSQTLEMRLPSLVAGIGTCLVIYGVVKKISGNFFCALIALVMFAASPAGTYYMVYAKGVMIELFFAAVSFFGGCFLLAKPERSKYAVIFVLSNVAGMYSMPTHLYFWLIEIAVGFYYIMRREKGMLRLFFLVNALVLLISICCYLPVLLGSGLSFVIQPAMGDNQGRELWTSVFSFAGYISESLTGYRYAMALIMILALPVTIFEKKFNRAFHYFFAFGFALLLLPIIIRYVQHLYIAERAIAFTELMMPCCAAMIGIRISRLRFRNLLPVLCALLFAGNVVISHFHFLRFWSARQDSNAIVIADLLISHNVKTCYDNAPSSYFYYYYPSVEYYYAAQSRHIELRMAAQNSQRYRIFSPTDNYDCIVDSISAREDLAFRKNYRQIYADSAQRFKIMIRVP